MSPLKDVFDDDGSAETRINRLIVRNKKLAARSKNRKPKIVSTPIDIPDQPRVDDEAPDKVLKKFKAVDYMNLFLARLPKRVKPVGFDEKKSINIFQHLVRTLEAAGASKRGVVRALTVLAKNISVHLADFKLPLTELNLRRFVAYRDSLAARLKQHLLPEGSLEWLLASDDAENTEFELDINRTGYMTEVAFTSMDTGDTRTLRIPNDQLHKHIQNREILAAVEEA